MRLQTVQVMDQYFNSILKSVYPNLDLENFSLQKKEQLSKAIDYYGNDLSLENIERIANEEQVNKFNTHEQRIGLTYLYKFDNNLFSEDELGEIQNDYQLKEIYDVISDESMREHFLNEISNNGEILSDDKFMFSDDYKHTNQFNLGFLLQNINLYEDIMRAQMDNLRNENEDKNQKRKQKKSKNKNSKQNRSRN